MAQPYWQRHGRKGNLPGTGNVWAMKWCGVARPLARALLCVAMSAVTLTSACAQFDDSASQPFTTEPSRARNDVKPQQPKTPTTKPRPKGPCLDPDSAVVATCMDSTGGLIVLSQDTALVTERRTGRILKVNTEQNQKPVEVLRIPVDGSGDGGLTSIALSPSYAEDGLIFAYISTASDNRVVRIARGDVPKEILTGIPKGANGNAGSITFASPTQLLVLTGDAGDPAAAKSRDSLAGKLLRVDRPRPGATATPVMSGIGTAGGVCTDEKGGIWVTDRTAVEDRLQRVGPNGQPVKAWTWQDHPGVGGCAASVEAVAVPLANAKAVAVAKLDQRTFTVTAAPNLLVQNKYGMLGPAALAPDGVVWVGTVNKNPGGAPGPFDDRVLRLPEIGANGSND